MKGGFSSWTALSTMSLPLKLRDTAIDNIPASVGSVFEMVPDDYIIQQTREDTEEARQMC